jgi:hypothetical protein
MKKGFLKVTVSLLVRVVMFHHLTDGSKIERIRALTKALFSLKQLGLWHGFRDTRCFVDGDGWLVNNRTDHWAGIRLIAIFLVI